MALPHTALPHMTLLMKNLQLNIITITITMMPLLLACIMHLNPHITHPLLTMHPNPHITHLLPITPLPQLTTNPNLSMINTNTLHHITVTKSVYILFSNTNISLNQLCIILNNPSITLLIIPLIIPLIPVWIIHSLNHTIDIQT